MIIKTNAFLSKIEWKIIWEAAKEPLRLFVLAIIPVLLTYFEVINSSWAIGLVFVLRFIDKLIHEYGKVKENESLELGLTRF